MGILGALIRKLRSGRGTRVEASLLNSGIDLQQEGLVNFLAGGIGRDKLKRDRRLATWFHAAPYGVYALKDGHVVLSLNDRENLAGALDSAELAQALLEPYVDRDDYARILASAVAPFTISEAASRFDARSIWWAPVAYYDELLDDPQIKHANIFRSVQVRGRTIHLINHPNRYDGEVPALRALALEIGEHTHEILDELGYSKADTASLIQGGGIVASRDPEQEAA
jgi:crotonobetainyl-CoA:carnitine CoA-transferase CaiB-like acyl-CoA transferase